MAGFFFCIKVVKYRIIVDLWSVYMKYLSVFDIIGPVMVGPSSSHTAGAVRIGLITRTIFGERPDFVKFTLYNSFAKTGKGHGTDKGLVGGLLGFRVDDERIKDAYKFAESNKIKIFFDYKYDSERHPNSVDIELAKFDSGHNMVIKGNSLGAGSIQISSIDGIEVDIRGDYHTLLLVYKDQPGMIWKVSKCIQDYGINIAYLSCGRSEKGQKATMSIFLDGILSNEATKDLYQIPDMYLIRTVEKLEK
ncbi:MAG: L-serine ammonia-lyase, iron-sulfur-dependent subunit beta [bacterium]